MSSDLNNRGQRRDMLNKLITSPKQTRPMRTKSAVENCILNYAYTYTDNTVEEIIFSKVSFCKDFTLTSVAANKLIIIEDCIFHGDMNIHCLRNVKIILRNCRFKGETNILNLKPGMLEVNGYVERTANTNPVTPDTYFLSDIATVDAIILN